MAWSCMLAMSPLAMAAAGDEADGPGPAAGANTNANASPAAPSSPATPPAAIAAIRRRDAFAPPVPAALTAPPGRVGPGGLGGTVTALAATGLATATGDTPTTVPSRRS